MPTIFSQFNELTPRRAAYVLEVVLGPVTEFEKVSEEFAKTDLEIVNNFRLYMPPWENFQLLFKHVVYFGP